jgi:hypothetical protein
MYEVSLTLLIQKYICSFIPCSFYFHLVYRRTAREVTLIGKKFFRHLKKYVSGTCTGKEACAVVQGDPTRKFFLHNSHETQYGDGKMQICKLIISIFYLVLDYMV